MRANPMRNPKIKSKDVSKNEYKTKLRQDKNGTKIDTKTKITP